MNSRTALAGLCLAAFGAGAAEAAAYIKFDGVDGEVMTDVRWKSEASDKLAAGPGDPQVAALLLPAVQKVREAAAARPRGMACTVGATLRNLTIRDDQTAQIVRVPEAKVTACTAEKVTLNFTKVEATRPSPRR
jgi:hypothetical protein